MNEFPGKPRLRVGRATTIALGVIVILYLQSYITGVKQKEARIAPHQNLVAGPFVLPNGPEMQKMLDAGAALNLTIEQQNQLKKLNEEWAGTSANIANTLKEESDKFGKLMDASVDKKMSINEIQKQSQPLSDATAKYMSIRDDFQRRAENILDPDQQKLWKKMNKSRKQK